MTPKIQVYAAESNDTHAGGCTQALHELWPHLQTQELSSPNAKCQCTCCDFGRGSIFNRVIKINLNFMTQASLVVVLLKFLFLSVRSDNVLHLDIRRQQPTTMESLYLVSSSPLHPHPLQLDLEQSEQPRELKKKRRFGRHVSFSSTVVLTHVCFEDCINTACGIRT